MGKTEKMTTQPSSMKIESKSADNGPVDVSELELKVDIEKKLSETVLRHEFTASDKNEDLVYKIKVGNIKYNGNYLSGNVCLEKYKKITKFKEKKKWSWKRFRTETETKSEQIEELVWSIGYFDSLSFRDLLTTPEGKVLCLSDKDGYKSKMRIRLKDQLNTDMTEKMAAMLFTKIDKQILEIYGKFNQPEKK
jgi:hypothetical protein